MISLLQQSPPQAKFRIPRLKRGDVKSPEKLWRPQLHLIGVNVAGVGEFYFLTDCDVCADSNLQCTVLGRTIDLVKARLEGLKVSLPQHLIVAADNTCRENRNQYVLWFLSRLVCRGLFRSASTEYSEVGHTHNIEDGWSFCFSEGCLFSLLFRKVFFLLS